MDLSGKVCKLVMGRRSELMNWMAVGWHVWHVVWNDIHTGHLVLLLPLHASVLEPDFDLALRETQSVGDLNSPPSGQVAVEVEFLLQLQGLVPRVWSPLTFGFSIGVYSTWKFEEYELVTRWPSFFLMNTSVQVAMNPTGFRPRGLS